MDRFFVTLGVFQMGVGRKRNSSTDAMPAKMARIIYSLRMNVFAPALISAETSRMVAFSTG